jgi:lipoprotein signal peptidase
MDRFSFAIFKSPAAWARFGLAFVIGLALDLWTKALAVTHLKLTGTEIHFIPGWLHFRYVENEGAVFGLGEGKRTLFLAVSFAAIVFLLYLFGSSGRHRIYQAVLGVLLAGVIGNMYDRIVYGYVRDMFYIFPERYWPGTTRELFPWVFNVADAMLCVGVAALLLYSLFAAPAPPRDAAKLDTRQ